MLPQKRLLGLYTTYTKGELTDIDSYLLFLALLNSTESIKFIVPAEISTSTPSIIANNIAQLVSVIWETNAIQHPSFRQPKFTIRQDTANLDNIKIWIKAWRANIEDFKLGQHRQAAIQDLQSTENKLSKLIFTPEAGNIKLAACVAEWADKAAEFPKNKAEYWKATIRKCYNLNAMFSTPKRDLLDIKEYCEENLEAGSIHFHKLLETLRAGIANHNDFLGMGSLTDSSTDCGYTLLDTVDDTKNDEALIDIAAKAPDNPPVQSNYPNKLAYLKARLAYTQAQKLAHLDTTTVDL